MKVIARFIVFAGLISLSPSHGQSATADDGELRTVDGVLVAWESETSEWLSPEAFWLSYADRRGGLTWGRRSEYPPYGEVKELDTLMIELDGGPCLMEFFHTRWRRANDVRRWDDGFNEYAGCPYVFD